MEKSKEQLNYEEFMEQYQDYYEKYMDEYEVYESFYAYGPLSDKYWKYEPKILVCNLEPYDQREGVVVVDVNLFKDWVKASTGKYTAKFITGLIKTLKLENSTESINFKNYCEQESLSYIENIAYMNFRISSGVNVSADIAGIMKDVRTHPHYLIKQINSLCPDITIIGGVDGCRVYNELFHTALKFNTTTIINDKVICSIMHFRRPDYKYYNRKVNEIIKCYMTIQSAKQNIIPGTSK